MGERATQRLLESLGVLGVDHSLILTTPCPFADQDTGVERRSHLPKGPKLVSGWGISLWGACSRPALISFHLMVHTQL